MNPKATPGISSHTRERILQESARLFATGTYASVTMRDIALACHIQPSSIYNYYEGKDKLCEAILQRFRSLYREYFSQLDQAMREETGLEPVMDHLFSPLTGENDIFLYYGLSIAMTEQFHNEFARQIIFDLFHVESVARVRNTLDRLRHKAIIPPQDTARVSNFFVYVLMVGGLMRLHQHMGFEPSGDGGNLFASFRQFFAQTIAQGV